MTASIRRREVLILDTGVLIDDAPSFPAGERAAISALSLAELEFGISAATVAGDAIKVRRRAQRLAAVRERFGAGLAFDHAAAVAFGRVTEAVLRRGRNPRSRAVDLLIASVAISQGAVLVTTQPQEFAGLEQLLEVRGVQ